MGRGKDKTKELEDKRIIIITVTLDELDFRLMDLGVKTYDINCSTQDVIT